MNNKHNHIPNETTTPLPRDFPGTAIYGNDDNKGNKKSVRESTAMMNNNPRNSDN